MSPRVSVPVEVLNSTLQFVDITSQTMKRALDEISVHRAAQEKAAALAPEVLNFLVEHKVVPANEKEAVALMLGAHDTSLKILKAAADRMLEFDAANKQLNAQLAKQAADLGHAVDDPNGGSNDYNSLTGVVGEKSAFVKESDKKLLKLIGK